MTTFNTQRMIADVIANPTDWYHSTEDMIIGLTEMLNSNVKEDRDEFFKIITTRLDNETELNTFLKNISKSEHALYAALKHADKLSDSMDLGSIEYMMDNWVLKTTKQAVYFLMSDELNIPEESVMKVLNELESIDQGIIYSDYLEAKDCIEVHDTFVRQWLIEL